MIVHQNGIASTTGPLLATCKPLCVYGNIWFVDSASGVDAVSPAGKERVRPLATLQQAVTNSADGDIIVLLSTHDETVSTTISTNKDLTIVGDGLDSDGYASPTLRIGSSTADMLAPGSARFAVIGVRFMPCSSASTASYIVPNACKQIHIEDCYFEMNGNNDDYGIKTDTSVRLVLTIKNTTFKSTATSHTDRPYPAVYSGDSSGLPGSVTRITGSTFDGGTVGFANAAGTQIAYQALGGLTVHRITGTDFLNGADLGFLTSPVGYVSVTTASGSMRIYESSAS